jgi:hypothetical protein
VSRRRIKAAQAIPVAPASRIGAERREAQRALAAALSGEYQVARRFAKDPASLAHEDINGAIDARLDAEARLGEWSD